MTIENILTKQTASVLKRTSQQIDQDVNSILSSLTPDLRGFTRASEQYNSDFFKNEPAEFKYALISALVAKFKDFQNSYWTKAVSNLPQA